MNNPPSATQHMDGTALSAVSVLTLVWGYNWVMMKIALHYAAPFTFAYSRTLGGGLCLLAVLFLFSRRFWPRYFWRVLLLGLLQTTFFIGFTTWSLVHGGAGKSAVLVYTMPFWVILLAPLTLKERIRDAQRFAVVLALVGLLLILSPWRHAPDLVSSLLALTAGLFWALSVLVAKTIPVSDSWDLLSVTGWQMLFGAVPLMVIAGIFPGHAVDWTPAYIGALLYNIVPANALAWLLWLFVVGRLSATLSGLSSLATPVIGVLAAWLQLGERPQPEEAAGMLLVLLALATLSLPSPRRCSNNQDAKSRGL